ncbi:major cell surface glycoprotein (TIGR04216 family) [Haloarcula quadrata]|uniref:Major cell surface glycoprotein (TIGR04216 family) n=1 Tax=Haloarcula quadrata TaxID=182779 RepID=A0A495QQS6_9EURY|nr:HVO_2072 family ArtA-dependent S-layer glycoprotein [Haloarcula quadrata]RKS75849.1 major cell surface glycoprotein (TIGR04216 family) [Haloarcula quadrata]
MTDEIKGKIRGLLLAAIMVSSVVALSAGPAAAAVSTGDRTAPDSVAAGETATVTATATMDSNGGPLTLSESFSGVASAQITDVSVNGASTNPTVSAADANGAVVTLGDTEANADVEVTYEVTAADSASDVTITGDLTGNGTVDLGTTTITVEDTQTPTPTPTPDPDGPRGAGEYDTSTSVGEVGPGATVFQGEEDLTGTFGPDNVELAALQKSSGDNEGILLEQPIPQDQPTGAYTADGNSGSAGVVLQTPRVTDVEVQNNDGGDVTGSVLQASSDSAFVRVDYNYQNAEDLEITVEDEDGLDVTEEIVTGSTELNDESDAGAGSPGDFDVGYVLDTQDVDEGEYTITVAGVEDLDFGDASETVTVNITSDQQASLDLDSDEVVQGENLGLEVQNSPEGNFHAVVIESSDFRDGITASQAANIFRSVGDVSDRGLVNSDGPVDAEDLNVADDETVADNVEYAYAIVEIDGGNGVGSIETQYLDDSSVDVDLYPASSSGDVPSYLDNEAHTTADIGGNSPVLPDLLDTDDDQSFEVTEGDVTLDSPDGTYVTGSQVDVNGSANEGVDEVAIYVRDNNDFELVTIDGDDTISVDGDDTFSEEDITLSNGNSLLQLPGTYRLGVIDEQDADLSGDGNPDATLTTSEFNSGVSSTSSIRVTDTALNGTFVTYNGQVASDDSTIDVEGQAPGKDSVVIAFVDSRGDAAATVLSVDDDDTFDEEDIDISSLSEGAVTAHIISSGRDGVFGDTSLDDDDLADAIRTGSTASSGEDFASGAGTGDQVRDRILANTVDDTASDDLIVNEQFRLSDGLTTIESATSPVETNGTIEVEGTTNRVPDDNTITVEVLDQEDESVTIDSTDEWGNNGQWSVSVDLSDSDVEPGNYTVESDDGDNTDRASIQIVEAGSLEEEQPETPETETEAPDTETETETDAPDTETEAPDTETEMPDTETEEATTEASGPGFTAAIALIALVAAALLAVRRDN